MASLYVIAGVYHFVNPRFYLKVIPPYIPWHKAMNFISGAAEIILGLLLFYPPYSTNAAWGIITLLILFSCGDTKKVLLSNCAGTCQSSL